MAAGGERPLPSHCGRSAECPREPGQQGRAGERLAHLFDGSERPSKSAFDPQQTSERAVRWLSSDCSGSKRLFKRSKVAGAM